MSTATLPTATIAKNQPVVDMLWVEGKMRENPFAVKAYRAAAAKVAGAEIELQDVQQNSFGTPTRKWLVDNLGAKTRHVVAEFLNLYPIKSEYERTGNLDALLPERWRGTDKKNSIENLKLVVKVLRDPQYNVNAWHNPLEDDVFAYYYRSIRFYNIWTHRHWFADEIEKHIEAQKKSEDSQAWWITVRDEMVELCDYTSPTTCHHKLVIRVEHTDGEVMWWCGDLPLAQKNGSPWDFSVRTLKNPKSPGNDVASAHLFALETVHV